MVAPVAAKASTWDLPDMIPQNAESHPKNKSGIPPNSTELALLKVHKVKQGSSASAVKGGSDPDNFDRAAG